MGLHPRTTVLLGIAAVLALGGLWGASPWSPLGGTVRAAGPSTERVVALTFDDGPRALARPMVLDILQRNAIHATFFLVGKNARRHPDIVQRMVREGHQVALHSYGHSYLLPFELPFQVSADTAKARDAVKDASGVSPRFYRPPHGRTSAWMRWAVRRAGYTMIKWSVSPRDLDAPSADLIVARVTSAVRPGSIVLLHDGRDTSDAPDRHALLDALPTIIQRLQASGYRFVTVAELLQQPAYR